MIIDPMKAAQKTYTQMAMVGAKLDDQSCEVLAAPDISELGRFGKAKLE